MQLVISIVFWVCFFFLNTQIIISDLLHKKIPNIYLLGLLCLLPFYYFNLIYFGGSSFDTLSIILQLFLSLGISFFLYYHGIWSAGDAKYLLILSLFLPTVGMVVLIGNLALLTVFYLLAYYLYFYIRLLFHSKEYKQSFIRNLLKDRKDYLNVFLNNHTLLGGRIMPRIIAFLQFFLLFLLVFVSIRLLRSFLLDEAYSISVIHNWFLRFPTYAFICFGALFFFLLAGFRFVLFWGKRYVIELSKKYNFTIHADWLLILCISVVLFGYLYQEYSIAPEAVMHKLYLIFTLYIGLFFIYKLLFFSYKLTFHLGEQETISLEQLRVGDIVDKESLIKLFGDQQALGAEGNIQIFSPNPKVYFQNIDNPISEESFHSIKKAYELVNLYHIEQKTSGFQQIDTIKILKTFSFGGYIFAAFLATYIYGERPMSLLIGAVAELIHKLH